MFKFSNPITKSIVFVVVIVVIAIVFETSQQLYYIKRYDINSDATFFSVLKYQSLSWSVWILLGVVLSLLIKRSFYKKNKHSYLYRYAIAIVGSIVTCIFTISVCQLLVSDYSFSFALLFEEYLPFFAFQKLPVYTLGYIALVIIAHLYFSNAHLSFQIQHLSELKKTHLKMYEELRLKLDDKASILSIKIGNNRKIIPVENILWIEADDYCVKVHIEKNKSYTMRSSLKSLQDTLPNEFLRIHRKAIVNMKRVREFNLTNWELILENEIKIPVSKSNLKMVKQYLTHA